MWCRSPAEGAYSEGFISSKFTQDYCIECPATSSLFSLKTGEIVSWYPTNPVLRLLTPQATCRNLQIYPVKLTQVRPQPLLRMRPQAPKSRKLRDEHHRCRNNAAQPLHV